MLGMKTKKNFNVKNIVGIATIVCIFCIVNLQYKKQTYTSTHHRIENVSTFWIILNITNCLKNVLKSLTVFVKLFSLYVIDYLNKFHRC